MAASEISEPRFAIVDPAIPIEPGPDDLDAEYSARWAHSLEREIKRKPLRAQRVMEVLGDVATASNGVALMEIALAPEDLELAAMIVAYFSGGCDIGVVYDDATERALKQSAAHQDALAAHGRATKVTYTKSAMYHEDKPNRNSEPARDKVRRVSLSFFIDRTVEWHDRIRTPAGGESD